MLPTTVDEVFPSSSILRNVMLYSNFENASSTSFVVIDHLRPKLPISIDDIIVLVYPEKGDMLNIKGDTDEVWFAHVLSIDERAKTCRVQFNVEDPCVSHKYIRESVGRAIETIHWNSIVHIASRQWQGTSWLKL